MNFDAPYPSNFDSESMRYFTTFAGQTELFNLLLSASVAGMLDIGPSGTVSVGVTTYTVDYGLGLQLISLQPITVPLGAATIKVPALIAGSVVACTPISSGFPCYSTGTGTVANMDFNIAGTLAVSFMPGTGQFVDPGEEDFSEVFTPIPEPSSWSLCFFGWLWLVELPSSNAQHPRQHKRTGRFRSTLPRGKRHNGCRQIVP